MGNNEPGQERVTGMSRWACAKVEQGRGTDHGVCQVWAALHGEGGLLAGGLHRHSIAAACPILLPACAAMSQP